MVLHRRITCRSKCTSDQVVARMTIIRGMCTKNLHQGTPFSRGLASQIACYAAGQNVQRYLCECPLGRRLQFQGRIRDELHLHSQDSGLLARVKMYQATQKERNRPALEGVPCQRSQRLSSSRRSKSRWLPAQLHQWLSPSRWSRRWARAQRQNVRLWSSRIPSSITAAMKKPWCSRQALGATALLPVRLTDWRALGTTQQIAGPAPTSLGKKMDAAEVTLAIFATFVLQA